MGRRILLNMDEKRVFPLIVARSAGRVLAYVGEREAVHAEAIIGQILANMENSSSLVGFKPILTYPTAR